MTARIAPVPAATSISSVADVLPTNERYAAARPLEFEPGGSRLNHNVFRYPAKFHPPIARKLLELFTCKGDLVLDAFCGSGTLLVEAATLGRNAIGTDIDPLAVMIAQAKTSLTDLPRIESAAQEVTAWLEQERAADYARWGSFDSDIERDDYEKALGELASFVPALPKINHWFRRRAILQLAAIRRQISLYADGQARDFLLLCFASILRNSSNADPVPVSGLEVTSHMLRKEALGRSVDPWRLLIKALERSYKATEEFVGARAQGTSSQVFQADARYLDQETIGTVSAAITSPPYLTAVDYYRRHTLEMYWLGLTNSRDERLGLMSKYVGRDRLGQNGMPTELDALAKSSADRWLPRFPGIKPERERAFRHYCDGMAKALARMAEIVTPGGSIVIVAGDVRFCGVSVSMLELMRDLASDRLRIADHLWYPIANRYMSYKRNNEANIAADHVLVFRRQD